MAFGSTHEANTDRNAQKLIDGKTVDPDFWQSRRYGTAGEWVVLNLDTAVLMAQYSITSRAHYSAYSKMEAPDLSGGDSWPDISYATKRGQWCSRNWGGE